MWNVMVLTVMMSVAGYYAIVDQKYVMESQPNEAAAMAQDMAVYRQVVVDYLSQSGNRNIKAQTVDPKDLPLPYWAQDAHMSRWSNYVGSDGTIYVFAPGIPSVSITQAITRLSRNSVLAGEAVADGKGGLKLHAPADVDPKTGNTGNVPIDLPTGKGIRPGSPVWLASRD